MTSNKSRTNSSSRKSSTSSRGRKTQTSSRKPNSKNSRPSSKKQSNDEYEFDYIKVLVLIGLFALQVLVFLFALGVFEGKVGMFITGIVKGLFGFDAFIIPIVVVLCIIYFIFKTITKKSIFNYVSAFLFVTAIGMIATAIAYKDISETAFGETMKMFYHNGKGGGVIFGFLAYLIDMSCGKALIWVLSIILIIASIAVMFGKYIYRFAKLMYEKYTDLDDEDEEEKERYKAREVQRMKEREEEKARKKLPSYKIVDEGENEKPHEEKAPTIDVEPSEVRSFFDVKPVEEEKKEEIKEAIKKESNDIHQVHVKAEAKKNVTDDDIKPINVYDDTRKSVEITEVKKPEVEDLPEVKPVSLTGNSVKMIDTTKDTSLSTSVDPALDAYKKKETSKTPKVYKFPSVNLLKKGSSKSKSGSDDILETANKLKETLQTFGVEVSIDPDNCSKGPAVTRYELIPAPGVKVSRIVNLTDDIKLSLGAQDIRIEAPIPGKSAVGIEVPNSESSAVPFRDLVDSEEFKQAKSKISVAVGKDLAGLPVITDIAKMPHLLIAGATGSGKSVCINTVIMSILYKAHPDDVKLILIDPKVVELSVYNGIPHLLLPVVTDPKQASASLHWGVSEMENRYKLFADQNVRDLKGYNEKIASEPDGKALPQIVIIVDELADLMMVAGKEVEESICRLAQLARAAGIHLIIATQRPSVDVITGLIKANMPSRIAFSVSSGIDSRTILDTTGAEKLLGKGDMLFFPQGLNKPARVQGCFVSDEEVNNVVDFIKNQNIEGYDERIIQSVQIGGSSVKASMSDDLDDLFSQAGEFIISKEKASIGALQRAFKIGFNRAARIMDQLEAKGVVGPEEGTKPRKILMTAEEFNALINSDNE